MTDVHSHTNILLTITMHACNVFMSNFLEITFKAFRILLLLPTLRKLENLVQGILDRYCRFIQKVA